MCRFLAYLGPEATLEELLVAPAHSLLRQSWEPRHQTGGVVNADGFGVGWYDHRRRREPARYRSTLPIWADRSFASMAGVVASTAVVAAVRSATPPLPTEESATPPFADGPWLFVHNGAVDGFREGAAGRLRRRLGERRESGIVGSTDSEVIFALVLERLDGGDEPGAALAAAVSTVLDVAPAKLNLVLTDGHRLAATSCGHSLFALVTSAATIVASEPSGPDAGWEAVPDGSLLEATAGTAEWRAL